MYRLPCIHPPCAGRFRRTILALLAAMASAWLFLPGDARAERAHVEGEYTVHYNAIPTTLLSADVARHYRITRSAGRGLINIAVLQHDDGAAQPRAVNARVAAYVRSLIGQRNAIELQEIVDQDAIYYIGDFRVRGEELLRFEVEVTPAGARRPILVRFEQPFVGD